MNSSSGARLTTPGDCADAAARKASATEAAARLAPFEHSTLGVLFTRPDGDIVAANPAACRLLQRDDAEIQALGRAGLADPTDDRWGAAVETRAQHGAFRGRLRLVRGDGSVFTADLASAIFLHDGEPWSYVLFEDASDVDAELQAASREREHAGFVMEMLDSISDAYFSVDTDWRITFFNRQAERLLGVDRADVLGEGLWESFPAARGTEFQHHYEHAVHTGQAVTFEGHYLGTDLRCEVRAYPLDGGGLAVYFLDVGDRYAVAAERERLLEAESSAREEAEAARAAAERARAELALRAASDDLTGLLNRSGLAEALRGELRVDSGRACLLLADLDNFKLVNDTLGHVAGDAVLRAFAERLRATAGPTALLARLGGDEFAIILPGDAAADAELIATRILDMARQPVEVDGNSLLVTASIGLATIPDGRADFGRLLRDADAALYRAKGGGRDRAAWFDDALHAQAVERVDLEQRLRTALASGGLSARYQAAFDLRTGRAVDVEALARWTDAERGPISPAAFIPVAEESGLIQVLGDSVLALAASQAARWASTQQVRVWVNVSPRQLGATGLADRIGAVLADLGLPPERFGVEITESSLVDEHRFVEELQAIHGMGVGLAVDDFGTGYSSLARLARMPVDLVKIDRGFVSGEASPRRESVLQGIVALGHALGARVTAEGVETPDELRRVIDSGCDTASGYLLQRPVEPEDVAWSADLS
ncbi:putative bifunctional diguanylate cyclase/phosphodiesterase [Demequina sp. SO4-13]|uniref:putative bifunctional diguanylate cyclase/phosphodiesterase n=1 Tax=Demequina sp. SO4-13 TaxID=3401027 RepID=UPI003AF8369E